MNCWPTESRVLHKVGIWGFPGGSVVKNLPAMAGDMGSIPNQGINILHISWWGQKRKKDCLLLTVLGITSQPTFICPFSLNQICWSLLSSPQNFIPSTSVTYGFNWFSRSLVRVNILAGNLGPSPDLFLSVFSILQ